jgi:hypothetical protein
MKGSKIMGYKTFKKIGNTRIEIEADSLKALLKMTAQFPAVEQCTNCKGINIYPSHHNYKGNDYYYIECQDCGATFRLGQKKEGNALYYKHDTKFEVYKKEEEGQAQSKIPAQTIDDSEDVPF